MVNKLSVYRGLLILAGTAVLVGLVLLLLVFVGNVRAEGDGCVSADCYQPCIIPIEGQARVNGVIDLLADDSGIEYPEWTADHIVADMYQAGRLDKPVIYKLYMQTYDGVMYFLVYDQTGTYAMDDYSFDEFWVKVDGDKVAPLQSQTGGPYLWEFSIPWDGDDHSISVHVTYNGGETAAAYDLDICRPTAIGLMAFDAGPAYGWQQIITGFFVVALAILTGVGIVAAAYGLKTAPRGREVPGVGFVRDKDQT